MFYVGVTREHRFFCLKRNLCLFHFMFGVGELCGIADGELGVFESLLVSGSFLC